MKSPANGGNSRATGGPISNHLRIDPTSEGLRSELCGNVLKPDKTSSGRCYLTV